MSDASSSVTIDDREIEVAKGTGLVETAEAAGIEIPVFCYEPRLGPPVGACRMCLVEVEGLPKLQAGCTLTAQDGMVVRTAATSTKAAEGQNGTLEFILVNHPLDCPVCDKGGECPLQDLTFRYGPGSTRMTFPKLTFDKPIPVSPLIALDRERCILCYRCTRFSSDVAEDGQLIARNRGAYSEIATFGDDPYRAPFSGNVVELCPVGALTSTQYRFEARPWEIQDVPTVCGLCPVGCNIRGDDARGQGQARPVAQPPRGRRRLALRQGPLRATRTSAPRTASASRSSRGDARARAGLLGRRARRGRGAAPRRAAGTIVTALSGSRDDRARLRARRGCCARGLGAHSAVLAESTSAALDAFRRRSRRSATPSSSSIVGDDAVVDRAPIVDLWLKQARRDGAEIVTIGARGSVPAPRRRRGRRARASSSQPDERARQAAARVGARGADLVGPRRGRRRTARRGRARARLRRTSPAARAFHLPATPNGRGGRRGVGGRGGRRTRRDPEPHRRCSSSPATRRPARPASARSPSSAERRDRDHDVPRARGRLGRPRPPRDRRARARGHAR